MSVRKNKRKLSPREFSMSIFELTDLLDRDIENMSDRIKPYASKNVYEKLHEMTRLAYKFNEIYTQHHPENYLRRNMCVLEIDKVVHELHNVIFAVILEAPKLTKKRIYKYTDLINEIIDFNAANFKFQKGIKVKLKDEMYQKIDDYNDSLKELCQKIMAEEKFDPKHCSPFLRGQFEKAVYVAKAKQLYQYTAARVKKFPYAMRITTGDYMYNLALDMFRCVYEANNIYPICAEELDERAKLLREAVRIHKEYDRVLEKHFGSYHYSNPLIMNRWMEFSHDFRKLTEGVIKSDVDDFKDLKPKAEMDDFEYRDAHRRDKQTEDNKS